MKEGIRKKNEGVTKTEEPHPEERHSVNLQIDLTAADRLGLEDFLFKIRRTCLLKFKRKPALGLQTICKLVLELIMHDNEFRDRIEGLLMERIETKKPA